LFSTRFSICAMLVRSTAVRSDMATASAIGEASEEHDPGLAAARNDMAGDFRVPSAPAVQIERT
jgi:hypothetical protein